MSEKLAHLPPNRAIVLRNETCPYCGVMLTPKKRTKEHVVGRRFVPRGSLHQHWNLIVWACEPCNQRKGTLEDDLSAISMHPDVTGAHVRDDVRLRAEAARKAQKSISQRSGKAVAVSQEELVITATPIPGIEFKFNLISAPQADDARIIELARMQMMAFLYWITIQAGEVNGRFWQGSFMPLPPVRRADWGNDRLRFFMSTTASWDPALLAVTADGYFKVAIRKHLKELVWSWALDQILRSPPAAVRACENSLHSCAGRTRSEWVASFRRQRADGEAWTRCSIRSPSAA